MRCNLAHLHHAPRPMLEQFGTPDTPPPFPNSNQPKRKNHMTIQIVYLGPGALRQKTRNNSKLRKTTTLQRFARTGFRRKITPQGVSRRQQRKLDLSEPQRGPRRRDPDLDEHARTNRAKGSRRKTQCRLAPALQSNWRDRGARI